MSLHYLKWHEQELILEKVLSYLSPCDLFCVHLESPKQVDEFDGCRLVNRLFNQTLIHSEFCQYYFEHVFCISRNEENRFNIRSSSLVSLLDNFDYGPYEQFMGVKRGRTEEDPMENNEPIQALESLAFVGMLGNCVGLKWKTYIYILK